MEQDFSKNQFACHFAELLGVAKGAKVAKALPCYAMNAHIRFCMSSGMWRIYVRFFADIDIKILGGGFLLHFCLLVRGVYVCISKVA